jgi:beta-lactam-binding protein with PASTA domain
VAVGLASLPTTFTATNLSGAPLVISPPTILGSGFAAAGGSCAAGSPVAVGGSCTAMVEFAPTLNIATMGGLAFFDNAPDTPQLVGLSGTGTGTHALNITPATLPVGYAGLPYPPSGIAVTFSSPNAAGGASFNICSIPTAAQPNVVCCPVGGFSIGPPCPAGLLPNGVNWLAPELIGTALAGSQGNYPFTVTASDGSGDTGSQNYTLTINPPFTVTLALASSSVIGGTSDTATVTLSGPAAGNGAEVLISSSATGVVPSTAVFVAAGQSSGTVAISTAAVAAATPVSLTAFYDGSSSATTLTVTPPALPPPPGNISIVETVHVSDQPLFDDLVLGDGVTVGDQIGLSATVPNLVGDSRVVASGILTTIGLAVGQITFQTSTTVPAGTVISQSPGPNSTESSGETINLVISAGLPIVPVPKVVNLSQAAAITALSGAGFASTATTQASNTVAAGTVISQLPVAGANALYGSSVAIVVSSGPAAVTLVLPESVFVSDSPAFATPVPNVVNETDAQARAALQLVGFAVGPVTLSASATVPRGNVISETPIAGSVVAVGSTVALIESSGAPSIAIVLAGAPVITRVQPLRLAAEFVVSYVVKNTGNVTASSLNETHISLNGVAGTAVTASAPNLAPGASAMLTATFSVTAGASGQTVAFSVGGTYSGPGVAGTWTSGLRVKLP